MKAFRLLILTPDASDISVEDAVSVVVPSAPGSFGAMADHAPMIAPVGSGVLRYSDQYGSWRYVVVGDGVAEVTRGCVTLMVDSAKPAPDEATAGQMIDSMAIPS